jgi:hypothetical protein
MRFFGTARDLTMRLYVNGVSVASDLQSVVDDQDTLWDLGSHSISRGDRLSFSVESSTGSLGAMGGHMRMRF